MMDAQRPHSTPIESLMCQYAPTNVNNHKTKPFLLHFWVSDVLCF